jgi:hypothetical protein
VEDEGEGPREANLHVPVRQPAKEVFLSLWSAVKLLPHPSWIENKVKNFDTLISSLFNPIDGLVSY